MKKAAAQSFNQSLRALQNAQGALRQKKMLGIKCSLGLSPRMGDQTCSATYSPLGQSTR
jgi:hypothetical protein